VEDTTASRTGSNVAVGLWGGRKQMLDLGPGQVVVVVSVFDRNQDEDHSKPRLSSMFAKQDGQTGELANEWNIQDCLRPFFASLLSLFISCNKSSLGTAER
jgi:hypothetical protein